MTYGLTFRRRFYILNIRTIGKLLEFLNILRIRFKLLANPLERIRPQHTPQRRVWEDSQVIHGFGCFGRVAGLSSVPLSSVSFGIDVIISRVSRNALALREEA